MEQKVNEPCNLRFPIKVMITLFNSFGQIMTKWTWFVEEGNARHKAEGRHSVHGLKFSALLKANPGSWPGINLDLERVLISWSC